MFHANKKFGDNVPDSACLIVVGLIVGYILMKLGFDENLLMMDSEIFFLYLLPPIMFDAGYCMPNKIFFENIDAIMLFALVGTILNCAAITGTLYFCSIYGLFTVDFTIYEILLFSSLVCATDPVAVLSVFEELKVNDFLYINVMGESLFNDAISAVLFVMFKKFIQMGPENLVVVDYVTAGCSFFVIALGGVLIGIFYAIVICLITKLV